MVGLYAMSQAKRMNAALPTSITVNLVVSLMDDHKANTTAAMMPSGTVPAGSWPKFFPAMRYAARSPRPQPNGSARTTVAAVTSHLGIARNGNGS
jgi:hypothetical protein